jgi:hypothetical protein
MPSLAILNAKVWTVNRAQPTAEAVAVQGDRITVVGSNAEVRKTLGPHTCILDAEGRLTLPGFNDSHVHFLVGGQSLVGIMLRDTRDEGEFVERLRSYVAALPKGEWVTGGQWDHEAWPSRNRPSKWLIDPVTPDHPLLIHRLDGHLAVANSLALRLADITRDTPDPPGGKIERDAETGQPTGILMDRAQSLVWRVMPPPTEEKRIRAAEAAMRHAAELGVTSVQSIVSASEFRLYQELHGAGRLTTRVYAILNEELGAAAAQIGLEHGFGDAMLRTGAVKVYADGSLGARSALLFEPYDDNPAASGLAIHSEEELGRMAREADAAGLQIVMHAIGDKAAHLALSALEQVLADGDCGARRHRIEHAQVVRPEDRARFARLGLIASLQPSHCTDDMRWIQKALGARAKHSYPFRSLLDAGARVCLGTDWPVEPLDPLLSIHAAVTREFPGGGPPGGWHPAEKVTVAEAVEAYTLGSAYAEFQDEQKGSIEEGKLADLVILSSDMLTAPPGDILRARVEMTILGGNIIYKAAHRAR